MPRDKPTPSLPLSASRICRVCTRRPACLPWDLEPEDAQLMEWVLEQPARVVRGSQLFRYGDPLEALYVVRSGAFKNYRTDAAGHEHVLGFSLPGELVGTDGIHLGLHDSNAVALQDAAVCMLPYTQLKALMVRSEALRNEVFRHVAKDTGYRAIFSRDSSAEQRMAVFLVGLSQRSHDHGDSAFDLPLPMSDQDIGSYLQLAAGTAPDVLTSFGARGFITRGQDSVRLNELAQLNLIARGG